MKWFGDEPFAPACHPSQRIPVEELDGHSCIECEEEISPLDHGFVISVTDESPIGPMTFERAIHQECFVFQAMGSAEHQRRRKQGLPCNEDCKPSEFQTKREAAYSAFIEATG